MPRRKVDEDAFATKAAPKAPPKSYREQWARIQVSFELKDVPLPEAVRAVREAVELHPISRRIDGLQVIPFNIIEGKPK